MVTPELNKEIKANFMPYVSAKAPFPVPNAPN
jgi:hypothetical protein